MFKITNFNKYVSTIKNKAVHSLNNLFERSPKHDYILLSKVEKQPLNNLSPDSWAIAAGSVSFSSVRVGKKSDPNFVRDITTFYDVNNRPIQKCFWGSNTKYKQRNYEYNDAVTTTLEDAKIKNIIIKSCPIHKHRYPLGTNLKLLSLCGYWNKESENMLCVTQNDSGKKLSIFKSIYNGIDNKSVSVTEYPWVKKNSAKKDDLKFISFDLKRNNHSLSVENFKKSKNVDDIKMDQYFPYRFLNPNEKKQELPYLFLQRYGLGNMCITVDANSHKVSSDAYAHFSSNDRAIRWSTTQPKKKSIVNIAAHEAEHAYQHKQMGRLTKGSDNYESDCWHKFGPITNDEERKEASKYLKASKIYPLKSDPDYAKKHDSNYLEIKSAQAGFKAQKEYSIGQAQLKTIFPYFPVDINMF